LPGLSSSRSALLTSLLTGLVLPALLLAALTGFVLAALLTTLVPVGRPAVAGCSDHSWTFPFC